MTTPAYYTIPESAWLFQSQISQRRTEDKKCANPEESVRQWCIHELIRSYGVRIDCIEIERLVKVAQERHPNRIDVIVLRDGSPYVVVECKSQRTKSLDPAMEQAENYGRMPDIAATYAVATNGDQWIVRRRIQGEWLPVPEVARLHKHYLRRSSKPLMPFITHVAKGTLRLDDNEDTKIP